MLVDKCECSYCKEIKQCVSKSLVFLLCTFLPHSKEIRRYVSQNALKMYFCRVTYYNEKRDQTKCLVRKEWGNMVYLHIGYYSDHKNQFLKNS